MAGEGGRQGTEPLEAREFKGGGCRVPSGSSVTGAVMYSSLSPLTQNYYFEIHPCCSVHQYFIPFHC